MQNTQYTISQVLQIAKAGFQEIFGEFSFWCVAEVVSVKQYAKVIFIECIEYTTAGDVAAKCTISVFNKSVLYGFFSATNIDEKTIVGQKILFNGHFSLYGDKLSIIADELSSHFTLGQLQQNQQHIREVLQKEGILTANKEKNLGSPPYKMAVISTRQAAGYEDFIHTLQESKIVHSVTLYDAVVHGNAAKDSVYQQLLSIKNLIDNGKNTYNMVLIIRGGGDTAGILWQNDIDIARVIGHMPIPVLVAIGHTRDISILEEISYFFAKTPTAAGQYVIDKTVEYISQIDYLYTKIQEIISSKKKDYTKDIKQLYIHISNAYNQHRVRIITDVVRIYELIKTYHPDNILKQGYAIIRYKNTIPSKNDLPMPGDKIEIDMTDMQIYATVDSIATKE